MYTPAYTLGTPSRYMPHVTGLAGYTGNDAPAMESGFGS